jgi:putative peptide zinc metalloprotease protein
MNRSSHDDNAPLPWQLRSDLILSRAESSNADAWVLKDPLRLLYFRVEQAELVFLKRLNGRRSLAQLKDELDLEFKSLEFSMQNLQSFLMAAVHNGLVSATVPGWGLRLASLASRRSAFRPLKRLMSLMTFRLRGIDPTRLLSLLDGCLGWAFTQRIFVLVILLLFTAASCVAARWEILQKELPSISTLLIPANLPVLMAAVIGVKLLHELGHGLTCRHFGGECHELGVLCVGLIPLLYCDVSDSWLQQDRRKRMAVAAAGILTELILASVCGILWTFSRAGFLHTFCLNVMIVCSINTLLVNGNPLLKFDGYFVLSDLVGIPNLAAESRILAAGVFDRLVLGRPFTARSHRSLFTQWLMSIYGTFSWGYRSIMLVGLLWLMHQTFESWNVAFLSFPLLLSFAVTISLSVFHAVRNRISLFAADDAPGSFRAMAGLVVLVGTGLALLLWPFRYSMDVPFVIEPGDSLPVFAPDDGLMEARAKYGDRLSVGAPIATLTNSELKLAASRNEGELKQSRVRLANLAVQRATVAEAAQAIPATEKAIESQQLRLAVQQSRLRALQVTSPQHGFLYPPRNLVSISRSVHQPRSWSNWPLEKINHQVWVNRQTLLGWVGSPDDFRATAVVPQTMVDLIADGAAVRLQFHSAPGEESSGTVQTRQTLPAETIPRELAKRGLVNASVSDPGKPAETSFAVSIANAADSDGFPAPLYSTGTARIECPPRSFAWRLWRYLCYTFTFSK